MLTSPREGVDRCRCGARHWRSDRCGSCGDRWRPWHTCALCGDPDPDHHEPTAHGGQALCLECYLGVRPA